MLPHVSNVDFVILSLVCCYISYSEAICDEPVCQGINVTSYKFIGQTGEATLLPLTFMESEMCRYLCGKLGAENESIIGITADNSVTNGFVPYIYYVCVLQYCHPHPKLYLMSVYNQRYRNNVRFDQNYHFYGVKRQPMAKRTVRDPVKNFLNFGDHPCNAIKWFNNLTRTHFTPLWKDQNYCHIDLGSRDSEMMHITLFKDAGGLGDHKRYYAFNVAYETQRTSFCNYGLEKASFGQFYSSYRCRCDEPECVEYLKRFREDNLCPDSQLSLVTGFGLGSSTRLTYQSMFKKDSWGCVYGISPIKVFRKENWNKRGSLVQKKVKPLLSICHIPPRTDVHTIWVKLEYFVRGKYGFRAPCNHEDCSYFAAAQHVDASRLRPLIKEITDLFDRTVKPHVNCTGFRPFNIYVYVDLECPRFYSLSNQSEVYPIVGLNVKPIVSMMTSVYDSENNVTILFGYSIFLTLDNQFVDVVSSLATDNHALAMEIEPFERDHSFLCPVTVNTSTVTYLRKESNLPCASFVVYSEDAPGDTVDYKNEEDGYRGGYMIEMDHLLGLNATEFYGYKNETNYCGFNYLEERTMCLCSQLMDCDDPRTPMKAHFLMFGPLTFDEQLNNRINTVDDWDTVIHKLAD